jgi:hypothetical protein
VYRNEIEVSIKALNNDFSDLDKKRKYFEEQIKQEISEKAI